MARGDYVKVKLASVAGPDESIVKATTIGSKVEVNMGKPNDPFIEVVEQNKGGEAVRTARFAKVAVISIVEGNEPTKRAKK